MSEFKGNNLFTDIHDQVVYKSRFQTRAYETQGPEVFEFNFLEYSMYGTVDNDGSSMFPNEDNIIYIKKDFRNSYEHQGFDFLSQMFIDVKRNIQIAIQMGLVPNDNSAIANMDIVRGYERPKKLYLEYIKDILQRYNLSIQNNFELNNSITYFSDYVKHLMNFFHENYKSQPLTFSAWLQSNENSIFATGLALSIADIPFSDDNQKYTEFMSSDLFSFYRKVVLNRGFRIWKHCPYVLVADLGSPAIQKYINNSVDGFLDSYYTKSYTIDYEYLYNTIIEYYNYFVFESPYILELKLGCVRRTGKEFRYRTEQSYANIDELYWINFYIDVRNTEIETSKQPSEINKIKRNTNFLYNSFDKMRALGYIDSIFKGETFKKSFGMSYEYSRVLERERRERIAEGITGGNTIGVSETGGGSSGGY